MRGSPGEEGDGQAPEGDKPASASSRQPERPGHQPSPASSHSHLYAEPDYLAANFAALRRALTADLRRRGVPPEVATQAFYEAVFAVYKLPPPSRSRRNITRRLNLVAHRAANRALTRSPQIDVEPVAAVPDEVDDAAIESELETRAALAAARTAIAAMLPEDRQVLIERLAAELVLMEAPLYAEKLLLLFEEGVEAPRTPAQLRRRLELARRRLRQQLRDWLVVVPVLRTLPRRLSPGAAGTGGLCTAAAAVTVVSMVLSAPPPSLGEEAYAPPSASHVATAGHPQLARSLSAPGRVSPASSSRAASDAAGGRRPGSTSTVPEILPPTRSPKASLEAGDRRRDDRSIVCVRRLRAVPDSCVDHPAYGQPPAVLP